MKILTYLIILSFTFQLYGSKIGDFKSKVKEHKSSSHRSNNSNDEDDDNYDNNHSHYNHGGYGYYNNDDFWIYFWGYLLFGDMDGDKNYSDYPYEKNDIGLYDPENNKKFTVQATTNYFHSNQLKGLDFNLKLAGTLVGLKIDFSTLWEQDNNGNNDSITFNNIFLDFYRIRESDSTLWWGVGSKAIDFDYTFALDLGFELFLFKPISFYIDYNVGFYENFIIQELNTSLNVYSGRYYLKVGYHGHYVDGAFLSGPTIGVGSHF